ncbi:hypothetical protein HBI18_088420 [Parastagonospora nodorum]|nr:hypothetical protein HBI18_088420 [Parastagonospora nodorum]
MILKRHTLQYLAPRTRNLTQLLRNIMLERYLDSDFKRRLDRGRRGTVLHCSGLTKTTTTTLHLNNIKLKAALTLTPDNCRTN